MADAFAQPAKRTRNTGVDDESSSKRRKQTSMTSFVTSEDGEARLPVASPLSLTIQAARQKARRHLLPDASAAASVSSRDAPDSSIIVKGIVPLGLSLATSAIDQSKRSGVGFSHRLVQDLSLSHAVTTARRPVRDFAVIVEFPNPSEIIQILEYYSTVFKVVTIQLFVEPSDATRQGILISAGSDADTSGCQSHCRIITPLLFRPGTEDCVQSAPGGKASIYDIIYVIKAKEMISTMSSFVKTAKSNLRSAVKSLTTSTNRAQSFIWGFLPDASESISSIFVGTYDGRHLGGTFTIYPIITKMHEADNINMVISNQIRFIPIPAETLRQALPAKTKSTEYVRFTLSEGHDVCPTHGFDRTSYALSIEIEDPSEEVVHSFDHYWGFAKTSNAEDESSEIISIVDEAFLYSDMARTLRCNIRVHMGHFYDVIQKLPKNISTIHLLMSNHDMFMLQCVHPTIGTIHFAFITVDTFDDDDDDALVVAEPDEEVQYNNYAP